MNTTRPSIKSHTSSPATPVTLHTPRLYLRPWRRTDLPPFARISADPQVMAHYPTLLTPVESRRQAWAFALLLARQGWGVWALERRDTRHFIGFCGLMERPAGHSLAPCTELAWRLARDQWGQGLASEAAHAVTRFAFAHLRVEQLVVSTARSNRRCRALTQQLGMHYAGEFPHPTLPAGHPLRPHVLYRLSAPPAFPA